MRGRVFASAETGRPTILPGAWPVIRGAPPGIGASRTLPIADRRRERALHVVAPELLRGCRRPGGTSPVSRSAQARARAAVRGSAWSAVAPRSGRHYL